jgi:hypothetical protein
MGLLSTIGAASARAYGFTRSAIAAAVDAYFNRVTLLLPGNGTNGAQNNTFLDSSSNNFTITRNGNTTQGTFSPFSQTGWGGYFDGNGDYLTLANSSNFSCSGNFTVDFFAYPTSFSNTPVFFDTRTAAGNTASIYSYMNTSGNIVAVVGGTSITSSSTYTANSWYYIAIVRSGTTVTLYVNSTSAGTATVATNLSDTGMTIGAPIDQRVATTSNKFTGYLSNFRFNNTTARTISSNPTSALTADSGTTLLTLQSNRFIDTASSAAITVAGDTSIQAFSPFAPTAAYSAATNGGSGYFDGSGDYLGCGAQTAYAFGTGTFTIEAWVYITSRSAESMIAATRASAGSATGWSLGVSTTGGVNFYNNAFIFNNQGTVPLNAWTHIAVVREGTGTNQTKLYINGASIATTTTAQDFTNTTLGVGSVNDGTSSLFLGYMLGFRMLKGATAYTGAFTPPIAPLATSGSASAASYSSTTNVNTTFASSACSILLNFTNGGIIDATAKNVLETVGNAQISTTQSKFGGSSMYFDGTGDYLVGPSNAFYNFGTGDFTIECWIRFSTVNAAKMIVSSNYNSGTGGGGWAFIYRGDISSLSMSVNSNVTYTKSWSPSANTWYHVAVCRSGTNMRLFVDGTQLGTTSTSSDNVSGASTIVVGGNLGGGTNLTLDGYIDDLRITNYARYTSNFTPPTAAFALQ